MFSNSFTKLFTLSLGVALLQTTSVVAQQSEPTATRSKKSDGKALVSEAAGASSAAIAIQPTPSCTLVRNGGFESQFNAPTQSANVANPNNSVSELPSWSSTNSGTPDYFATNADVNNTNGASVNPFTTPRGTFTPRNYSSTAVNGSVGIAYTTLTSVDVTEYITQQLTNPLTAGKRYYAEFYAHRASTFSRSARLGLNVTATNPTNWSGPTPVTYTPASAGIQSPGTLDAASTWMPVQGMFQAQGGEQFLNVGYFDLNTNFTPIGSSFQNASYYYIDDIALYEVPEAGPNACVDADGRALIGTGCSTIPGATYAWTSSETWGVIATNPRIFVSPTGTTVYTLTVTLPNGQTYSTSTTVYGAPTATVAATLPYNGNAVLNDQGGVCVYTPLRFTASATNSNGTYSWQVLGKTAGVDYQVDPLQAGDGNNVFRITPLVPSSTSQPVFEEFKVVCTAQTNCGVAASRTMTFYAASRTAGFNCNAPFRQAAPTTTKELSVDVYPNPAVERMAVTVKGGDIEQATLYDSFGNPLKQLKLHAGENSVDVRGLRDGLYYLRMRTSTGQMLDQRVVVQH